MQPLAREAGSIAQQIVQTSIGSIIPSQYAEAWCPSTRFALTVD